MRWFFAGDCTMAGRNAAVVSNDCAITNERKGSLVERKLRGLRLDGLQFRCGRKCPSSAPPGHLLPAKQSGEKGVRGRVCLPTAKADCLHFEIDIAKEVRRVLSEHGISEAVVQVEERKKAT
jgi:hypothetical protein